MKFLTLSPIVTAITNEHYGRSVQHFLDYMNPEERGKYVSNIVQNLLRKYKLVYKKDYAGSREFDFSFDVDYIVKRQGKIKKNIRFKKDYKTGKYSRIVGMEAPFTIKADVELIKIGYQCGFGEKNSAGFGMVEKIFS